MLAVPIMPRTCRLRKIHMKIQWRHRCVKKIVIHTVDILITYTTLNYTLGFMSVRLLSVHLTLEHSAFHYKNHNHRQSRPHHYTFEFCYLQPLYNSMRLRLFDQLYISQLLDFQWIDASNDGRWDNVTRLVRLTGLDHSSSSNTRLASNLVAHHLSSTFILQPQLNPFTSYRLFLQDRVLFLHPLASCHDSASSN